MKGVGNPKPRCKAALPASGPEIKSIDTHVLTGSCTVYVCCWLLYHYISPAHFDVQNLWPHAMLSVRHVRRELRGWRRDLRQMLSQATPGISALGLSRVIKQ